eukprot:gene34236-41441_t
MLHRRILSRISVDRPFWHPHKFSPVANLSQQSSQPHVSIDFNDTKVAFKAKTTSELLRSLVVFSSCQIKPLVNQAEPLLKFSYKYLGHTLTDSALRATFFGHFCAGQDEESIRPVIKRLESYGVGSILDYAAESDVTDSSEVNINIPTSTTEGKVQGRVYDYRNEELCDQHMQTFVRAIEAVKKVTPTGFAAIKLTALGNPELLKRVSTTLVETRRLFHKLDKEQSGFVTREAFLQTFSTKIEGQDVLTYFNALDSDRDGRINYIEWTNNLQLEDLPLLTKHCTQSGPLSASVLSAEELVLLKRMKARVYHLAELAKQLGVRLMIDAEHSYFQPAIDFVTQDLCKMYNAPKSSSSNGGSGERQRDIPVIFSTYQMYLKDSMARLTVDMDRAQRGGYTFAAKLVRGAYMVIERQHAQEHRLEDPIHDTIQNTHENYNRGVQSVIERIAQGQRAEVMIATHNQDSVSHAVACMQKHGMDAVSAPVYFGQLLGMADHLTFGLAHHKYKAYKYVPYGKVHEVMPYLIRRAQENSDALSGAQLALRMSRQELARRISGSK